jgi:hypothetical protein
VAFLVRALVLLSGAMLLPGCGPSRGPAVPTDLTDRATVLGDPALRTWDHEFNPAFLAEVLRTATKEIELRRNAGDTGPLPPADFLAISGGGADGAYGAGLLCGWTAAGTRPEFKVVTGVSTGALTAPFAFLGPKYDEKLRKVYTSVNTDEICSSRGVLAAVLDDALMDTVPLRALLDKLMDEEMVRDIAREYARGRFLVVATTNLDADRGVLWNIGAIASRDDDASRKLLREILIASAAIPAAFPPVMVDVEVDGKRYQEMHVDGGAKSQVFLYPPSFQLQSTAAAEGLHRDRIAYVIRNARLDPTWVDVRRRTLSIAGRAISSLIASSGNGDLYRIFATTQRDGVDFNLAYIPAEFTEQPTQDFDPVYMTKLFNAGYNAATQNGGYPWRKAPPGFAGSQDPTAPPPPAAQPSAR